MYLKYVVPLIATAVLSLPTLTLAQPVPFLSEEDYQYLVSEVSGDAAYDHIRFATRFHRPRGGAPGLMEVARYFEAKAKEYGLEDVRLLRQKSPYPGWEARSAELWIVEPQVERVASLVQTPLHLADYSHSADLTAELVDVGAGDKEADYEGVDVRDKIVLAWGSSRDLIKEAVALRGAKGLIMRPDPTSEKAIHYSHQIAWNRLPWDGEQSTFAFVLSHAQGAALAERLRIADDPIKVRAQVDAERLESWQVMVEGFIKGTGEAVDQDVVLTGHLQEEKTSANDDASGCASTLEIARALSKLIREGSIAPPRRNLRFWWVTEIGSQRQFFADYPEESKKLLVNINQDMVGANQGQDVLRVQNITQLPFSRPHFLNDVAEAVIEFVVRSNTTQLAKIQAGTQQPFSRPILSHLGSRDRYAARMIPFHNNTDHMTFNEAPIGVPGITFTNWPDNYIHTSDDDLWNIDRTQLQRNAFAVAAMAYTVARAANDEADAIAGEMLSRGSRRIAEAFGVASKLIREESDKAHAFRLAKNQVGQAVRLESRAVGSLADVAPDRKVLIDSIAASFMRLGRGYEIELAAYYRTVTGDATPPEMRLTQKEKELREMVPEVVAGPAEFLGKREKVEKVEDLHGLMAFEILNFIDGQRNGLEIYEATVAEALQGGADYYGTVSPEQVGEYLEKLVSSGLVAMNGVGTD